MRATFLFVAVTGSCSAMNAAPPTPPTICNAEVTEDEVIIVVVVPPPAAAAAAAVELRCS
jgi:hypothetical protein